MSLLTPNSSPTVPLRGCEILILDAETVDETKSIVVVPPMGVRNHTITFKASAQLTNGDAQIETASDPDYTGLWNPLGGGPFDLTYFTAAGEYQFQFSNIIFTALRVRIADTVVGGTLSATYKGDN